MPFAPFRGHCSSWPGTRRVFRIGHSYQDEGPLSTVTSYDGRGYRIRKVIAGGDTFDYYQNEQNQTIEVRKNGDADAYEQYVFDQRYIDAPVLVYRDPDTDGAGIQSLYVLQDANFNVTAILDGATGVVVNRFVYSPYGQRTVLDGSWQSSTSDFLLGHQGLYLDEETGLYYNRARYYHPTLGRFIQRDPLGYVDGGSLYECVRGRPLERVDPMGLRGRDTGSPVGGGMHSGAHGGDPLNVIGKIWNGPNTVIGLGWGTVGWILSGGKIKVKVAHNQIAFIGHPLMITGITFGNVGVYVDEDVYEVAWPEEEKHTIQGEVVGPLYLLLHLIGGVAGIVSDPSATGLMDAWHGPGNFMESGPMDEPPHPWPWDSSVDDCP